MTIRTRCFSSLINAAMFNGPSAKVVANIAMAYVGAGVLGIPFAIKEAGYFSGMVVLTIVGTVTIAAMHLLVDAKYFVLERVLKDEISVLSEEGGEQQAADKSTHLVGGEEKQKSETTHGDVAEAAFGPVGRIVMDVFLICAQLGLASAYYFFISENLALIVNGTTKEFWVGVFAIPFFVMTLESDLNRFAKFSAMSQVANAIAFGVILGYEAFNYNEPTPEGDIKPIAGHGSSFVLIFSLSIYSFEGAGLILSLENSMGERGRFKMLFGATIATVTAFYIIFGSLGFACFGNLTQELITSNMISEEGSLDLSLLVKVCLCFSLYFSYPLMLIPVCAMIEQRLSYNARTAPYRIAIRMVLVALTASVILAFPQFVDLLEMVGATCCSTVAFILPALIHMKLFGDELTMAQKIFDGVVLSVGVLALCLGIVDMVTGE